MVVPELLCGHPATASGAQAATFTVADLAAFDHPGNARFVQNADYIKVPFNTLTLTLTNTHPKPTY